MAKPKVKIMLDSGAFSAWSKGEKIDLDQYIAYIKANEHCVDRYVNLDVIPGSRNKPRTQAEVEDSAKQSYANLRKMKAAGLNPIPVFHRGERFYWLHKMLDEGEKYIGVSPSLYIVGANVAMEWLDRVFTILTDAGGKPSIDTHGFAVSSFDLLKRYPWTTCDATSWALTAAFGSILVPVYRNGAPDYAETPVKLSVSEVDRKRGSLPPDHYLRYGPLMKRRVLDFLEHEVGVSVEDAAKDYEVRARAVVYFMRHFEAAIGERPFRFRQRGLW